MDQLETPLDTSVQDPEATSVDNSQGTDTVPPPTAPVSPAPVADDISTFRALAQAAIERERRLQAELDAMRMANTAPPKIEEPTEEEFQASPFAALKKLIAAQQAPVQDYIKQQRRANEFNNEFALYVERTPAIAPFADQIRSQLSQSLLSADGPVNQSVIDIHTKALIGNMVLNSANQPSAPSNNSPAASPVVPPTPPKPRPPARPADPTQLTESQIRVKKQLDPDGKIWADNKSFLEYLSSESRVIPL